MLEGIKSVLVAVTEEGRDEEGFALSYALSLAKQASAHLTVQAAASRFSIPYSMINDFGHEIIATENRRIAGLAETLAVKAKAEADLAGVVCAVESPQLHYNSLVLRFLDHARVHDLSVLDAESVALDVDRGLIEAALFESGRPVLVVPPGRPSFSAPRILIAWDGSAAAARATADALPFLRAAEAVEILSVVGEKDLSTSVPGADLAPHLTRHGVNASVRIAALPKKGDVAEAIQNAAAEFGAGLVVSGGYRHSRLREWLLGGVTQSLLKNGRIPLLMCH
jgi:nucleotide-binding universal stress UspA family protein